MRPAVVLERQAALAIRILLVGLVVAGSVLAFRALQPIVLPLLFALLLTALLMPIILWLERHGVRHIIAVAAVIIAFVALLFGTVAYVTSPLIDQANEAVHQVERGIDELPDLAESIGLDRTQVEDLTDGGGNLGDNLGGVGRAVSSSALSIAGATVSVAFGAFLSLVLLVYLLYDGKGFWNGALRLIDANRRERAEQRGVRSWHALQIFVRSQVIVALIDAIGIAAGLLALGVPLVLPLGVMTFVLSFVPYIGATLSGLVVALVALSTTGPEAMLAILAIAALVQFLESNFVYPLLVGRNLRLHPITVLLAVGIGSSLLGVLGAFFATPILATVAAASGLLPDVMDGEEESPVIVRADAKDDETPPGDAGRGSPEVALPEQPDPAGASVE